MNKGVIAMIVGFAIADHHAGIVDPVASTVSAAKCAQINNEKTWGRDELRSGKTKDEKNDEKKIPGICTEKNL